MRSGFLLAPAALAFLCGCAPEQKRPAPGSAPPPEVPRILHFYVFPAVVERGSQTQLCYGVSGVTRVSIEPGFPETPAFLNRCVAVSPERDTEYTLTASGPRGEKLVRKVSVVVEARRQAAKPEPPPQAPASPSIVSFTVSPAEVARGGQVSFCYVTSGAASVRIEPPIVSFRLPARGCFGYVPETSATYTLVASDESGEARKQVAVTVR